MSLMSLWSDTTGSIMQLVNWERVTRLQAFVSATHSFSQQKNETILLGLTVLDLGPIDVRDRQTDVRQADVRPASSLNIPA